MNIKLNRPLQFILFLVLFFWFGAFIPHFISQTSKNTYPLGVLNPPVGYIYVDKDVGADVRPSDLPVIRHFFHSQNNGPGMLGQDLITKRITVVGSKLADDCGIINVKLYTFFNIKFAETGYTRHCP